MIKIVLDIKQGDAEMKFNASDISIADLQSAICNMELLKMNLLSQLGNMTEVQKGEKLKKPLWVCTSRVMKEAADRMGFTKIIEKAGGQIVADTCMVVSPIEDMGYKTTGVNSGKAANYLPGFCKQQVVFADVDSLIKKVS